MRLARASRIAHPAADDERAAAGVAHGAREVADDLGSCSTVHASIIPRMTVFDRSGRCLLRDLVAIDSVNPSLAPGAARRGRRRATDCRRARAIGLRVEVTDAAPGRPNVVGVLDGRAPGRSLMFCGHTDTVGVSGMRRPFAAEIRDGRLYGRGAQDMKGGVAAMIGAVRRIAESGGLARGQVIVAAVVDEEHASIGADALVAKWRADAAVVTEPTESRHRGRAQRLSVDCARDARSRGAWQPAARRA